MGQQLRKVVKRRRRAEYLKRKKDQSKLTGTARKAPTKKAAADKAEGPAAKKVAKKAAKKVAKKAPAKKVAKKAPESAETSEES